MLLAYLGSKPCTLKSFAPRNCIQTWQIRKSSSSEYHHSCAIVTRLEKTNSIVKALLCTHSKNTTNIHQLITISNKWIDINPISKTKTFFAKFLVDTGIATVSTIKGTLNFICFIVAVTISNQMRVLATFEIISLI